jgi:hypothetical protein
MEFSYARNVNTGKVVKVPTRYLTHPVIGKLYEPAERHDKDYLPEMYKPPVPGEPKPRRNRNEKKNEEPETVTEIVIVSDEAGGEVNV